MSIFPESGPGAAESTLHTTAQIRARKRQTERTGSRNVFGELVVLLVLQHVVEEPGYQPFVLLGPVKVRRLGGAVYLTGDRVVDHLRNSCPSARSSSRVGVRLENVGRHIPIFTIVEALNDVQEHEATVFKAPHDLDVADWIPAMEILNK